MTVNRFILCLVCFLSGLLISQTTQPSNWSVNFPDSSYQVKVTREGGEMTGEQILIKGLSQILSTENEGLNLLRQQIAILNRMDAKLALIELHLDRIEKGSN